jgi:hypothetical protein
VPLSVMCDSLNIGRPNQPPLSEVHERSTAMQYHVSDIVTLDMADTYADRWLSYSSMVIGPTVVDGLGKFSSLAGVDGLPPGFSLP